MKTNFETIYGEHREAIYRVCLGYVKGNAALAEDLTQEVFLKVLTHLDGFRNEAKITTWLYRIAVNTCLMELRKSKYVSLPEQLLEDVETPSDPQRQEDRYKKLHRCIDRLKKDEKTMILLDLEDVPQKEIAAIMGTTHEAVRVRIHRIKKTLTHCVHHGKL
ncbi:sigma-70 family RNA polymerase sigma factor [Flagellimonas sp. DF-77]|uniref:RNA polymerase sigma factor n=1 Tax=Flagellimonas algarum TaxID=3230298 RepID=UPI00339414CE